MCGLPVTLSDHVPLSVFVFFDQPFKRAVVTYSSSVTVGSDFIFLCLYLLIYKIGL